MGSILRVSIDTDDRAIIRTIMTLIEGVTLSGFKQVPKIKVLDIKPDFEEARLQELKAKLEKVISEEKSKSSVLDIGVISGYAVRSPVMRAEKLYRELFPESDYVIGKLEQFFMEESD